MPRPDLGAWLPIACVITLLNVAGCVNHPPISEATMFHDPATRPTHTRTHGGGGAFTFAPAWGIGAEVSEQWYLKETSRRQDHSLNAVRLSAGLYYVAFDQNGRLGISGTFGLFAAGLDATVKLYGRNYLTAALSHQDQWQVYLQHRAFNSPRVGAAFGIGVRRDGFTFSIPSGSFSAQTRGLYSTGLRGMVILRADDTGREGARFTMYLGYLPDLGRPYLTLSLTTGRI